MEILDNLSNYINGLFGRNSEKYFFAPKQNTLIGKSEPVWIDTDNPYKIYQENPHVNLIVNRVASMFSNMTLRLVDKDGNVIDDKDFDTLIQNPNALQGMNDFLSNYLTQKLVFGNQFMYKSVSSSLQKYPTTLINISPKYIKPILTGKYLDQTDIESVVDKYKVDKRFYGKEYLKSSEVMWSRILDINDPLVGVSPLASMKFPITNTKLSYEYLNVISSEKGAIGILSNYTKDGFGGSIQLDSEERKRIENQYRKDYGLSDEKMKVILTDSALNWIPMTYPTKDLLLLEQVSANFLTLVDHFKLNANIFSTKDATFENLRYGLIQSYQDCIFPEADSFTQNLTKFLKIKEGYKIIADYSHLEILKNEKEFIPTDIQGMSDNLSQLVTLGFISRDEARNVVRNTIGTYINE